MPEDSTAPDDGSRPFSAEDGDRNIVRTEIDPDSATAEYDLLEIVAELEATDIEELPEFYGRVGHFVELIFKEPPAPEAQMNLEFSYAGYRITINQRGEVTLMNVKRSAEE
jgi:hypothetical protein